MSLRRHILQVVALVTAVALVFGAFAGSAGAKKISKSQKAKIRAELRKQVKKNPGIIKRRGFLRKAGLVDFKLPVTIRIRNTCEPSLNPTTAGLPAGAPTPNALQTTENCASQGTALNQRTVPSASVNLGPSLGTRQIALGGALAAVVEFNDTYDGGALGNVNLKILPNSSKKLVTSSVPLLWNEDITRPGTRTDSNFAKASFRGAHPLSGWADTTQQGCASSTNDLIGSGPSGNLVPVYAAQALGAPVGYKALFYNAPAELSAGLGTGNGLPGYPVYTSGGFPSGVFLPIHAGVDNPLNIKAGGVVGNNDWVGTNPFPFPSGSAPGTGNGSPSTYGGAPDTVLRTNALSLGIAPGGVSVNMSTGTAGPGLNTAQGSDNVTLGYSGGQANLFGNIPGKNVGIDVTVNLETKINSIVRIMDQDVFKSPGLIENENYPAGIFNCRQLITGAVQNYIPGVRLTGSLRIAPAITKDGKVRIAKATVTSHSNDPDRVALSACLFPAKSYNAYNSPSTDTTAAKVPTQIVASGGTFYGAPLGAKIPYGTNPGLPADSETERYPDNLGKTGPDNVRCGADTVPELADIIRQSGLTGTVSGLPDSPADPAFAGIAYNGEAASVAGDITVNTVDVDVLIGDRSQGT